MERDLTFFFFNDTATTEIYTLSLHDALPILVAAVVVSWAAAILALVVRAWLRRSARLTIDLIRGRGDVRGNRSGKVWPPAITVVAIAVLVVAGPVLADMLNYATD